MTPDKIAEEIIIKNDLLEYSHIVYQVIDYLYLNDKLKEPQKLVNVDQRVMLNFADVIEITEQSLAQWKLHIEENEQKDITDISHWEALEWKKLNAKLQTNKSKISA